MSNPTTNDNGLNGELRVPFTQRTIEVGEVAAGESSFIPQDQEDAVWADYMITHRYEGDLARYMLGVASPNGYRGKKAAFVQLHAPTLLWIVDWTAMQFNAPPQVPDPFSVGADWELLDVVLEPAMLGLASDGVSAPYRFSGTYVFGHTNPGECTGYTNSPFTIVQFPRPPWLEDIYIRKVPADALASQLITWQGGGGNLRAAPGVPFVGRRN